LSRPQATARARFAVSAQVKEYQRPSRRPHMASLSGVVTTRCWNISTTERNVGSLMARLPQDVNLEWQDHTKVVIPPPGAGRIATTPPARTAGCPSPPPRRG